jgi:hypothetical protein
MTFKRWGVVLGLLAAAGIAGAQAGKAINTTCPVKTGTKVDGGNTVTYKGKVVSLCCGNCKAKWMNDPETYAANIPELAPVTGPTSLADSKAAYEAGKSGSKPTLILFTEGGPKTDVWYKMLTDAACAPSVDKCAYAAVKFDKTSEDAKALKVTTAPTLVIVDATGEAPKVIKSMAGGTPKSIATAIDDAVKKLTKK